MSYKVNFQIDILNSYIKVSIPNIDEFCSISKVIGVFCLRASNNGEYNESFTTLEAAIIEAKVYLIGTVTIERLTQAGAFAN